MSEEKEEKWRSAIMVTLGVLLGFTINKWTSDGLGGWVFGSFLILMAMSMFLSAIGVTSAKQELRKEFNKKIEHLELKIRHMKD
jgi:uncharacterized membrane protein YfcA